MIFANSFPTTDMAASISLVGRWDKKEKELRELKYEGFDTKTD